MRTTVPHDSLLLGWTGKNMRKKVTEKLVKKNQKTNFFEDSCGREMQSHLSNDHSEINGISNPIVNYTQITHQKLIKQREVPFIPALAMPGWLIQSVPYTTNLTTINKIWYSQVNSLRVISESGKQRSQWITWKVTLAWIRSPTWCQSCIQAGVFTLRSFLGWASFLVGVAKQILNGFRDW